MVVCLLPKQETGVRFPSLAQDQYYKSFMEISFERHSEAHKESIDQRRVMLVQLNVMKMLGLDSDEKALEYIEKYAARFRNLVEHDAEIKMILASKDIDDQAIASRIQQKLIGMN